MPSTLCRLSQLSAPGIGFGAGGLGWCFFFGFGGGGGGSCFDLGFGGSGASFLRLISDSLVRTVLVMPVLLNSASGTRHRRTYTARNSRNGKVGDLTANKRCEYLGET